MTLQELKERQSWSLEQKIDHSLGTIEAFINRVGGVDKVYISFSGGKDSTVLFHLARILYPDILGVFLQHWKRISAPSLSLAQKWLREVKGINVRVNYLFYEQQWFADWIQLDTDYCESSDLHFRTYEEALSDGIDTVLNGIETFNR